jgi:hypothetical protein
MARGLTQLKLQVLVAATGLTESACSRIRAGEVVPHPRHWATLRTAVKADSDLWMAEVPRTSRRRSLRAPSTRRGLSRFVWPLGLLRLRPENELSVVYDRPGGANVRDALEWVRLEYHDVGPLARFEGPDGTVHAEPPRGVDRRA